MWIQRVSWIGLVVALAAFVAGLGIHLATFAGINVRLYVPNIANFVNLLYIPAFVGFVIAFWFRNQTVRSVTPLPEWVGTTAIVLAAVVAVYAVINMGITAWHWAPFPNAEDQLLQLRTDSSQWMMVFFIAVRIIADYGLGLFRFGKSAQAVGR